jgi:diguanylate cyclase (GGDEF)-like protein
VRLTTPGRVDDDGLFGIRRRWSPTQAWLLVLALLLVVFVLDWAIVAAPVQHLYYVPIILAASYFGMRGGVSAALAATIAYHVANFTPLTFRYEESDVIQIALFFAVGVVTAKLTDDARRLHLLAMTDDLTGLHNLRSFEARLAVITRAALAGRTPLALLVLDVDHLKLLNDAHGHLTGAEAVRAVGHVIAACLPDQAVACRYGGDEFVVALPDCSPSRAVEVADEVRRAVNAVAPVLAGRAFPAATLSISIGVASGALDGGAFRGEREAGDALFRAADAALYRAKESGRNRVWLA